MSLQRVLVHSPRVIQVVPLTTTLRGRACTVKLCPERVTVDTVHSLATPGGGGRMEQVERPRAPHEARPWRVANACGSPPATPQLTLAK